MLLMTVFALGFASCESDFIEATPQSTPQEQEVNLEGFEAKAGSDLLAPIDLNALSSGIAAVETTYTPTLSEKQTIEYVAYVSSTESSKPAVKVNVTDGQITATDVNDAFRELLGNTTKAKDLTIKIAAYGAEGV